MTKQKAESQVAGHKMLVGKIVIRRGEFQKFVVKKIIAHPEGDDYSVVCVLEDLERDLVRIDLEEFLSSFVTAK